MIIHSLSRFTRDSLRSELCVRQLEKAGVQPVLITQDVGQDGNGEFRKVRDIFDDHQSRENGRQVHRAMCENTRQGFWNGSDAPYGYRTEVNSTPAILSFDREWRTRRDSNPWAFAFGERRTIQIRGAPNEKQLSPNLESIPEMSGPHGVREIFQPESTDTRPVASP